MSPVVQRSIPSPVGELRLVASPAALLGLYFPDHRGAPSAAAPATPRHPVLDQAERELREYFEGKRRGFSTPLRAEGTAFQDRVWASLLEIPYGARRSYRELATSLERPRAVRAVATANARNPLSIFVPCHRVIGSDGSLRGYAGGLAAKRWLLEHERRLAGAARR